MLGLAIAVWLKDPVEDFRREGVVGCGEVEFKFVVRRIWVIVDNVVLESEGYRPQVVR